MFNDVQVISQIQAQITETLDQILQNNNFMQELETINKYSKITRFDHYDAYKLWINSMEPNLKKSLTYCSVNMAKYNLSTFSDISPLTRQYKDTIPIFRLIAIAHQKKKHIFVIPNYLKGPIDPKQLIESYNIVKEKSLDYLNWHKVCSLGLLCRYGESILYSQYIRQFLIEHKKNQALSCQIFGKQIKIKSYQGLLFDIEVTIEPDDGVFFFFPLWYQLMNCRRENQKNQEKEEFLKLQDQQFSNLLLLSFCATITREIVNTQFKEQYPDYGYVNNHNQSISNFTRILFDNYQQSMQSCIEDNKKQIMSGLWNNFNQILEKNDQAILAELVKIFDISNEQIQIFEHNVTKNDQQFCNNFKILQQKDKQHQQ